MSEEERMDIVEGVDEEGNRLLLRVDRYFYYNGEEYVLLSDDVEGTKPLEDATGFDDHNYCISMVDFIEQNNPYILAFDNEEAPTSVTLTSERDSSKWFKLTKK